jgi:DNA-binding NarL/FixJ family response regulator
MAEDPPAPRVVIADDDETFATSLARLLEVDGRVEVVGIAANGEEAVQLAVWQDPDIVLMDVRMPVLGGIEATRLLRESRPRICVLMVSGAEPADFADAAEQVGAAGVLEKSQVIEGFVERILELVEAEDRAAERRSRGGRRD